MCLSGLPLYSRPTMGLWYKPFAGFFAAVAVVCVAYFSRSPPSASIRGSAYSIGCWAAHQNALGKQLQNYAEAYEPTNLPFWVTLAGGALGSSA